MTTKAKKKLAAPEAPVHRVISLVELANHFQLTSRGILKMVDAGNFPEPIRVGRRLRWRVDLLNQWIEAGCPPMKGKR